MCYQQSFVCVLTAFRAFWHTYICFDPNYRTVVVASSQMLLAQRIFDMVYFVHYYNHYVHLLPIIMIYNPEETCCHARPASVIIISNAGPCRGRAPSRHYQAFFVEYVHSTTFAWILDVWQLKSGLNQNFRHDYYCQSSQNLRAHILTVGR